MNAILTTGFLVSPAVSACGADGVLRLSFEVMIVSGAHPDPAPWRCEARDLNLVRKFEGRLKAGQAVILRGQLAARPHLFRNQQSGWTRFLMVEGIECARVERATSEGGEAEGSKDVDGEDASGVF